MVMYISVITETRECFHMDNIPDIENTCRLWYSCDMNIWDERLMQRSSSSSDTIHITGSHGFAGGTKIVLVVV